MKPIWIILAVLLLSACSVNHEKAAAEVCTSVASCCRSVNATLKSCTKETGSSTLSLSMHELNIDVLTW